MGAVSNCRLCMCYDLGTAFGGLASIVKEWCCIVYDQALVNTLRQSHATKRCRSLAAAHRGFKSPLSGYTLDVQDITSTSDGQRSEAT